jgi:catechol 2,3-dioxygenase-like lactoylglutathione lyase family enzyme
MKGMNAMKLSHVHLGVRDLAGTLAWLKRVLKSTPVYRDAKMAVVPFGPITVIFDRAKKDSPATLAYSSRNCDRDYRTVLRRGAQPVEPPGDRVYGVRSAYAKGPGDLTFEIEQPLPRPRARPGAKK